MTTFDSTSVLTDAARLKTIYKAAKADSKTVNSHIQSYRNNAAVMVRLIDIREIMREVNMYFRAPQSKFSYEDVAGWLYHLNAHATATDLITEVYADHECHNEMEDILKPIADFCDAWLEQFSWATDCPVDQLHELTPDFTYDAIRNK